MIGVEGFGVFECWMEGCCNVRVGSAVIFGCYEGEVVVL